MYGTSQESVADNGAIILTIPDAPLSVANLPLITSGSQIGVIWSEGAMNGGAEVLDYKVWSDQATDTFIDVGTGITATQFTITSLIAGNTYKIKVQARNIYGYSADSEVVSILAAQIPDQPSAPTTEFQTTQVEISWTAPFDQGSAITGYKVVIALSDAVTFSEEITDCDMSSDPSTSCVIPVQSLKAQPYSLNWGTDVYAKVTAINTYGVSAESDAGNGATIITNPDAPTTLAEDYSQRTATSLTITWVEGPTNGGSQVLDFVISSASGTISPVF